MDHSKHLVVANPLSRRGGKKFLALCVLWAATSLVAGAQTLTTLHSFNGPDGANPFYVTLVQGRDGNLFGTTSAGGSSSACSVRCGTAFKITPQGLQRCSALTTRMELLR